MRLEIWHKIGLSGDWCLCTALHTRSDACYYWIGLDLFRVWPSVLTRTLDTPLSQLFHFHVLTLGKLLTFKVK